MSRRRSSSTRPRAAVDLASAPALDPAWIPEPAPRERTVWPFVATAIAAVGWGVFQAIRRWWTTDDAYISFRYAEHLVRGDGLVYNAGERVEGYSNFLWTVWDALGMRLGAAPEAWANVSGIACFAATLAVLCALAWKRRRPDAWPIPVAALGAAFHPDWNNYATSGLETACFALLAVAGYAVLAAADVTPRRALCAGVVFALATLTRPDGVVLGAVAGLYVLWTGRPRGRAVLAYALPLIAVGVPYAAWKLAYYGDLFPNTYYAKSASVSWYAQGLVYLRIYFQKYWVLLAAVPIVGWGAWTLRGVAPWDVRRARAWRHAAALAAALALAYGWYVVRVGGDFMYARLLIPTTAFLLILLELGLERVAPSARVRLLAAAAIAASVVLTPYPFPDGRWIAGITDEATLYDPARMATLRETGRELERLFAGLPVRIAIGGSGAVVGYYSHAPVVIESSAGLTDRFIAHLPLDERGRVGHEKAAPFHYLIDERRAHFFVCATGTIADSVHAYVPQVNARFGAFGHTVLTWDPRIMSTVLERGGEVEDFPGLLEGYIENLPNIPDDQVAFDYERLKRFYFVAVHDPAHEEPFLARLRTTGREQAGGRAP